LYSFNQGEKFITQNYSHLLSEITLIVNTIDVTSHKSKVSKEKTKSGRMLYNPKSLNSAFKKEFSQKDWKRVRVLCEYSSEHYTNEYKLKVVKQPAYREMDFVKERIGVEVQFGKYAFMVYNVCAKMTIFSNLGQINCGVEIVPVKVLPAKCLPAFRILSSSFGIWSNGVYQILIFPF
jgi:Restriction endonuclease BglII